MVSEVQQERGEGWQHLSSTIPRKSGERKLIELATTNLRRGNIQVAPSVVWRGHTWYGGWGWVWRMSEDVRCTRIRQSRQRCQRMSEGWAAFARARLMAAAAVMVVQVAGDYILCKKRLSMPGPPSVEPIIVADIAAHL